LRYPATAKCNPGVDRANPFITCTTLQVGNLSAALLLPTSGAARVPGGLQTAAEDGIPMWKCGFKKARHAKSRELPVLYHKF
jgi:hypothetical protein